MKNVASFDDRSATRPLRKKNVTLFIQKNSKQYGISELLHSLRSYDNTKFSHFVRCLRRTNQKTAARIIENGGDKIKLLAIRDFDSEKTSYKARAELNTIIERRGLIGSLYGETLSFERGDEMETIDPTDIGKNVRWWMVKHLISEKIGFILRNHVVIDYGSAFSNRPTMFQLHDLPREMLDIILQRSYLHWILNSPTKQRDKEVIRSLMSVDVCFYRRITRRRFKKAIWRCLKAMANSKMANDGSDLPWKEPRCLIESNEDELKVNQDTLAMLDKIKDPVVPVGIVGLYRTGKSYLMNRLAGQTHGFALGSTIQSKTKGIWVWCVPHPTRSNCCLVLFDTEGLGDIEKGSVNHDMWIFVLTVLLSSTMVYNSIGTITQQALSDLHFVTEMTEHIKIKSKGSDDESAEFNRFFPSFIWAIRDFILELKIDGKTITEDEYLEHALKPQSGLTRKVKENNHIRECITTFFRQRKCFGFPRPLEDENMMKVLESVKDSQLNPKFLQKTNAFLQYVFESGSIKTINGKRINGRLLGGFASLYVDAIRNGAFPCIESAVESTAKIENERAVREALDLYIKRFKETVRFPTVTIEELSNCHHDCEREAAEHFVKVAIFDSKKIFYQKMMNAVTSAYESFVNENETASRSTCQSLLSSLHRAIEEDFKAGKYSRPGGYQSYKTEMDSLCREYKETLGKGVMSEAALGDFMKQQEVMSRSIMMADEQLTEATRKIEEERQKGEASVRQKLATEEECRKKEQLLADEKKSLEEHHERLKRQAEEERKQMQQSLDKKNESTDWNQTLQSIAVVIGAGLRAYCDFRQS